MRVTDDTASFDFDTLLAPVAAREFLDKYWERKPLRVSRGQPDYHHSLLTLGDVDSLISSATLRYPDFRLIKAGDTLPPNSYSYDRPKRGGIVHGVIDVDAVYSAFAAGATIVVESLDQRWKALGRLCKHLEDLFHHPFQSNTYLSPPESQGLEAHADSHDVFVLQVSGLKQWKIYESPVLLARRSSSFSKSGAEKLELLHEFVLKAGDMVYIPRGFVHEARTITDSSLHITVGSLSYSWADLIEEAFRLARDELAELRETMPVGSLQNEGEDPEMERRSESALSRLSATLTSLGPSLEFAGGSSPRVCHCWTDSSKSWPRPNLWA